jgi:hypothetical protein
MMDKPQAQDMWRVFARKNLIRVFVRAAIAEALHRRAYGLSNPS